MSDEVLTMLAESASAFAAADPGRGRRYRGADPGYDIAAWKQIAGQGWLSIVAPESSGGLGLGISPAAVVARAFGRAVLPEPLVAVGVLGVDCLAQAEDVAQWRTSCAEVMAGEITVAVAWQDQTGRLDLAAGGVTARAAHQDVELSGTARFVAPAAADVFLVAARDDGGLGLYWVLRDHPGLTIIREPCADGSALALLRFDRVRVSVNARVVGPNRGEAVLQRAIDLALVASASELVGVMDGALAMTLDYLRTRRQLGATIGSFQALQHRAVDIWMQRQIAEAAVNAAAQLIDRGTTDQARSVAASGAKARASQAALLLCNQALQLHGAIGFADEYGLGLHLNRALTLSAWLGNATQHRKRYGELVPLDGGEPARIGDPP